MQHPYSLLFQKRTDPWNTSPSDGDQLAHAEAPQRPVESRARSPSWKLPSNPPPQKDLPGPTWPGEQALSAVSSPGVI